jgi:hypothetical protein
MTQESEAEAGITTCEITNYMFFFSFTSHMYVSQLLTRMKPGKKGFELALHHLKKRRILPLTWKMMLLYTYI